MSSVHKWDLAAAKKIASSKVTISTATTTSFDFGTPDDINLAAAPGYGAGDRLLVVLTASTAGSTDSITWVIQDAPDNAGSIGTPAAAVLSAVAGALAAGTGDDYSAFAVKIQPGRPWLRVRVTSGGATDTFVCHASVYAMPSNT
ncbi:MAG: hypothetical protein L0Y54_24115 [Sporichthyaceae bacterium]|nr:hypothetical protein [Sporichthyaceae bacterium]